VPELSRFFGIVIYMNWRDHNPPHVHALYGEHEALVSLDGAVLAGELPRRALSMVHEWLAIHRPEWWPTGNGHSTASPCNPLPPWSSP
jgi:hypothetical protein